MAAYREPKRVACYRVHKPQRDGRYVRVGLKRPDQVPGPHALPSSMLEYGTEVTRDEMRAARLLPGKVGAA